MLQTEVSMYTKYVLCSFVIKIFIAVLFVSTLHSKFASNLQVEWQTVYKVYHVN